MISDPSSSCADKSIDLESEDEIVNDDNPFSLEVMMAVGASLMENGGDCFEDEDEEADEDDEAETVGRDDPFSLDVMLAVGGALMKNDGCGIEEDGVFRPETSVATPTHMTETAMIVWTPPSPVWQSRTPSPPSLEHCNFHKSFTGRVPLTLSMSLCFGSWSGMSPLTSFKVIGIGIGSPSKG